MLAAGDLAGRRAHDAYHRFVRCAAWSPAALWQALAVHAIEMAYPGGVIELLAGDTVAHKTGGKIAGAGSFRDAVRSTCKKVVYCWGRGSTRSGTRSVNGHVIPHG